MENLKIAVFVTLATVLVVPVSVAQNVDLFLIAGQSNAQGWQGNAAYYPEDPEGLDSAIKFYWVTPGYSSSKEEWTTLKVQGGLFEQGHFGPEVTFARALKRNGYNPAIFKYSLGSTSIANNWKLPGEDGMYDRMVNEFRKATRILEDEAEKINIRAFIWIQGESDAETKSMAEAYYKRLKSLIKDIRMNVIGNPNLPVILGVDEQHPWVTKHPEVVQAQLKLAKDNEHITFTSMRGLDKADATHLTPEGLKKHGVHLFKAYKELIEDSKQ